MKDDTITKCVSACVCAIPKFIICRYVLLLLFLFGIIANEINEEFVTQKYTT